MDISVKNYRGCELAEFSLAPVALVCGLNEAGKTSIAQAVSAALTRNAAPIDGIAKNAAKQLLRDGTSRGNCRVGDDSGWAQANWPGASCSDEGNAPRASDVAVGMSSFVDLKTGDRASMLISLMDALPSRDRLGAALADVAGPDVVDKVWASIQADGWDAAHKRARTKGTELKGAWEAVAGEKWGKVKGEGWAPAGVDVGASEAALSTTLQSAEAGLETAIRNQAASGARRKMLEDLVSEDLPNIGSIATSVEAASAEFDRADAAAKALPHPDVGDSHTAECPHCAGLLVVVGRSDVRAPGKGLDDAENQRRQAAIESASKVRGEAQQKYQAYRDELAAAQRRAAEISRAKQELEAMPSGGVSEDEIATARLAVSDAKTALSGLQAALKASLYHKGILTNEALAGVLSADGLRREVLAEKLAEFNKQVALICVEAGWPVVAVGDDMSVTYGGRAYILLSASAQFRARVALQLVMAGMDGSDAVIVDAADILDRGGRNGLFKAIGKARIKALVCMTMNGPDEVPRIAKAGLGQSYWIGGSVLAAI